MKNTAASLTIFTIAAVVGFVYGQAARKSSNDAVQTEFSGGVATVKVDTLKLAGGGLNAFLSSHSKRINGWESWRIRWRNRGESRFNKRLLFFLKKKRACIFTIQRLNFI